MYLTGQDELLRVGWVAGSDTLGRQSIFLASRAAELARQGVASCIFCPRETELGVKGVEVYHYTQPHWLALGADKVQSLVDLVQDVGVNVLHALDESSALQTAATADRLAKPYFISCYRIGARLHLPHKGRGLAGMITAGQAVSRSLEKRRIASEEAIHLLRPGVWIAPEPKPLEFQDRRAMVLADVYDASNGVAEAVLRSFADVRHLDGGALFFLLHSPRQERSLRRRAEALGLLGDMTFMTQDGGGRSMHVVQSADVFIAAGARKEFDWGALLAMAAGVPVLAVASQESEFLSDGMTASLFSAGDADALTALLVNVLSTPAWGRAQARAALQYLHVYHNPIRSVTEMAKLYRAACAPREPVTVEAEPDG
jgi:hypothetical protein